MVKQYFSKYHKKWVDLKSTDNENELKKYGYKIRNNPKDDINIIHWALKEKGLDAETTRLSANTYRVRIYKKKLKDVS